MNYIYDIALNFFFNDRVVDFYEWSSNDFIENFNKIPVFRVEYDNLVDFINNDICFFKDFFDNIDNFAITYDNNRINNCFLLTDLSKVFGFITDDNGRVIARSSLLLDEEDDIINECVNINLSHINYKIVKKFNLHNYLTRKQNYIRNILINEVNLLYSKKKYDELLYFYNEIYSSDNLNIKEKFSKLMFELNNNYNDKFNVLYNIIKISHKKIII